MVLHTNGKVRVQVIHAGPGETRFRGKDLPVLRGTLTSQYYYDLEIPTYQRELMKDQQKHKDLMAALDPEDGVGFPDDMLLCVRSGEMSSVGAGIMDVVCDGIYVLDGYQRTGAAWARLDANMGCLPMGVKVIFNTTIELEKEGFFQHNRHQLRVAANVHLNNNDDNAVTDALRKMVEDNPSLIHVKWGQKHVQGTELSARTLYQLAVILHAGRQPREVEEIDEQLLEVGRTYGTGQLVANMITFFTFVHDLFNDNEDFHLLKKKYMWNAGLLQALALVFGLHANFWSSRNENALAIPKPILNKLRTADPEAISTSLKQKSTHRSVYSTIVARIESGRDKTRPPYLVRRADR